MFDLWRKKWSFETIFSNNFRFKTMIAKEVLPLEHFLYFRQPKICHFKLQFKKKMQTWYPVYTVQCIQCMYIVQVQVNAHM